MSDRAQHHVLFVDHMADPAAHGVESPDQFPRIGRPLFGQFPDLAGPKGMGLGGQRFQRSRDIAAEQDQRDQQQQIGGNRLEQQGPDQQGGALAHGRGNADPPPVCLLRGDDDEAPRLRRSRSAAHRAVDRIIAPLAPIGTDQMAGHAGRQVAGECSPDFGKPESHIGKGLAGPHFQLGQAFHAVFDGAFGAIFQPAPAPGPHRAAPAVRTVRRLAFETKGYARNRGGRGFHQILVLRTPVEQKAVDPLRKQQHQRHDQQQLADQASRPQAYHRDFTSPART